MNGITEWLSQRLSGNDIPEMARIISVADAFDAMTSKRTYRDSLSVDQAVFELKKEKILSSIP